MTRWQYAWMTDQPATTIGFSHPQPGLALELGQVLGPGVYVQSSTEWSISLDRARVNLGYVSGLLGDRGWEMFAVETRLQPGAMNPAQVQTNWYFKRQASESATTSVSATAAAAPAGPATVAPGFSAAPGAFQPAQAPEPAPAPAAAPVIDAPAAPAFDAPAAPTIDAPAAPAGPEPAPAAPTGFPPAPSGPTSG